MMSCPKGWEETRVIIIFFLLKKSPVSCLTCLTSCFTWHMLSVTNANSHSHRPSHCYWLASIATSRDWKENCTSRLHLYITRRGLEPKHLWYCRVCYVRGASPGGSGGLGVFCRQSYELAWLLYNWHIIIRVYQKSLFGQGRSGCVGQQRRVCQSSRVGKLRWHGGVCC